MFCLEKIVNALSYVKLLSYFKEWLIDSTQLPLWRPATWKLVEWLHYFQ